MAESSIMLTYSLLNGRSGHEAGRELLVKLYRQATGESLPPIATSPRGKPYFPDSSWHFSISHTPRHAFCVLADVPVGMDAEEMDRQIDLRLAPGILSPQELTRWEAAADPRLALLKLWVLKEAQGKLTGKGVGFHPRHTDFDPDDPRVQLRDGCLVAVLY